MTKYRVAKNCSIMLNHSGHRIVGAGEELDANYAEFRVIENHIRSGFVVPIESKEFERRDKERLLPPDVTANAAIVFKDKDERNNTPVIVRKERKKKQQQPAESVWNIDPELLKNKTLEELTLMALERDTNGDQVPKNGFESVEEAIEFLSKDFGK